MIEIMVDPFLTNDWSKGQILGNIIANLFSKFENEVKNNQHDFDTRKRLLDKFQEVFEATQYIKSYNIALSEESNSLVEISKVSNAVNIPSSFKELLILFSDFVTNRNGEFMFIFNLPSSVYFAQIKDFTEYFKRSILKEIDVLDVMEDSDYILIKIKAK